MSEAAGATPGGPAEAAAPSASQVAGSETPAPARKPLAPIRTLPGVYPDGDPFPSPPPGESAGAEGAQRERGPDGRFVAASSTATDGGHTRQGTEERQEPPTPSKYKFAGEDFDSQAAAEQSFKTLRGQFKPVQQLARSLGGIDKVVPRFAEAAESARGWKAAHDALKAELDSLRAGQPAKATQPEAPAADKSDVDWELYAEVKKLANESGEPWKAEQWLIEQVRKADEARYKRMLDERMAPLDQQQEQQATVERTETLFTSMAGMVDAAGKPAFPELGDETAAYEVGRLWAQLGLPKEAALTPQGAMAAIGLYRLARGGTSQAGTAPETTPTVTPPPQPSPNDTVSAAGIEGGRPSPMVNGAGNGGVSGEAARILAGLRQVSKGNRSALGFDA